MKLTWLDSWGNNRQDCSIYAMKPQRSGIYLGSKQNVKDETERFQGRQTNDAIDQTHQSSKIWSSCSWVHCLGSSLVLLMVVERNLTLCSIWTFTYEGQIIIFLDWESLQAAHIKFFIRLYFIRTQKPDHKRRNRTMMIKADTDTACGLYLSLSHRNNNCTHAPILPLSPTLPPSSNTQRHTCLPSSSSTVLLPSSLPPLLCGCWYSALITSSINQWPSQ